MVYLVAVALIVSAIGFYRRSRVRGVWSTVLDTIAAALLGWISGWLIGIGARIGMWSITFFNGSESRFTFDGTLQVVLAFSLYGIGLSIIYEFVFRHLLGHRGLVFGLLVTIVSSYPLGSAALQQLSFTPAFLPLTGFTLLLVGLMFMPFSVVLEFLLSRWHEFREKGTGALTDLHVG